jgi:hypothetical protein
MLLPIILLAGCGLWVINEALEIFSSGMADIVGTTGGLANGLLAIGIFIFWIDPEADGTARTGTIAVATGMALMSYRSISLAFIGARSDTEMVASPIFLVGAIAIVFGVIMIGAWIVRSAAFPRWIGVVLIGCTLGTLALAIMGASVLIQSGANIVLAVTLAETAVLAMGRKDAPATARRNEPFG